MPPDHLLHFYQHSCPSEFERISFPCSFTKFELTFCRRRKLYIFFTTKIRISDATRYSPKWTVRSSVQFPWLRRAINRGRTVESAWPVIRELMALKTVIGLQWTPHLISWYIRITKQTSAFPTRSVVTRIPNIVVIPIWANSESVYCSILTIDYKKWRWQWTNQKLFFFKLRNLRNLKMKCAS